MIGWFQGKNVIITTMQLIIQDSSTNKTFNVALVKYYSIFQAVYEISIELNSFQVLDRKTEPAMQDKQHFNL